MKKITIINTALLTGIMLNGGLQIHAAAQDGNKDQKRIICATEQQNAAATLLQAACRGTLERQFVQHGELVRLAELVRPSEIELARLAEIGLAQSFEVALAEQAENNGAATLIQAGVRGTMARGILTRDEQRNNDFLPDMQSISTGFTSDSSEDSQPSEDNELLNQLLQRCNNDLQEALFDAVKNNSLWAIKGLLQCGVNVDFVDEGNDALLAWATRGGHEEAVRMLIAAGAKVDIANQNGTTPLILAAWEGYVEIMQVLLEARADVNIGDQNDDTALMVAASAGRAEMVRMLIAHGVSIDIANQDGDTALILASCKGRAEIVRMLIAHGASVDIVNQNGDAALILAVFGGRGEVVRALLEARANVNIGDENGDTPLILAVRGGCAEIVGMLIEAKADINLADQVGDTALIVAIQEGRVELIRILIAAGANIAVAAKDGIPILVLSKNREMAQLLIDLFRAQLAKQYPTTLMEFISSDYEQFNADATLQSMGNVFNQVGEVIVSNISDNDRRNLINTGCGVLVKFAVNRRNGQSHMVRTKLFTEFITIALRYLVALKKKCAGDEQMINRIEEGRAFFKQELECGYYIRTSEPTCAAPAIDVAIAQGTGSANAQMLAVAAEVDAQMLVADAQLEAQPARAAASCAFAQQVAQSALEAERALRAEQEEELAQSEAVDRRKAELEEQIGALTEQVRVLVAGNTNPEQAFDAVVQAVDVALFSFDAASLELCQKARDLYISIIAARTELIELIQADQTVHEIFVVAKAARLAEQNEMLAHERAQLQMVEHAIDAHVPTQQELQAMREQRARMLGGQIIDRKGKSPA